LAELLHVSKDELMLMISQREREDRFLFIVGPTFPQLGVTEAMGMHIASALERASSQCSLD
jgi:hypothetical protein